MKKANLQLKLPQLTNFIKEHSNENLFVLDKYAEQQSRNLSEFKYFSGANQRARPCIVDVMVFPHLERLYTSEKIREFDVKYKYLSKFINEIRNDEKY